MKEIVVLCLVAVLCLISSQAELLSGQFTVKNKNGNWILRYPNGVQVNVSYGICPNKKPHKIKFRMQRLSYYYDDDWEIFKVKVVKKFRWGFTALIYRTAEYSRGAGPDSIVMKWRALFGDPAKDGPPEADARFFYVGGEKYCICQTSNSTWCKTVAPFCDSNPCLNGGRCVNVRDGYKCTCPKPFKSDRCDLYNLKGNYTVNYQSNSTRYHVPFDPPVDYLNYWVFGIVRQGKKRIKKFQVKRYEDYNPNGFYVYIKPRRWKNQTQATVSWHMDIYTEYNRKLLARINKDYSLTTRQTSIPVTASPPQVNSVAISGVEEVNWDFTYCIDKVYGHIVYDRCYPSNATKVEVSIVDAPVYRPPFVASVLNISVWGFTMQIKKQNIYWYHWSSNNFNITWKAWFDQSTLDGDICQNEGVCLNSIKGQRCQCFNGYSGQLCDDPIKRL